MPSYGSQFTIEIPPSMLRVQPRTRFPSMIVPGAPNATIPLFVVSSTRLLRTAQQRLVDLGRLDALLT